MAGIYIHIPFCTKACHYCNFHFSTSLQNKNEMIASILCELEQKKEYAQKEVLETIYFGGGTPSILSENDLAQIMNAVHQNYTIAQHAEITLEANPDDLDKDKINTFIRQGINRLSIGIQSFHEEDLQFMNRSHSASQALQCIQLAQDAGISNLSIDLIFGFPLLSDEKWEHNINTAIRLQPTHLSCYAMTVEPKTALQKMIALKKTLPVIPEQSAKQYEYLMTRLFSTQYEHYEISSFAQPNKRAVHNSNYWNGKKYIGIGPSAHSFNGKSRQWNIANNALYIKGIQNNQLVSEEEILTQTQRINETIMIQLRKKEGLALTPIIEQLSKNERLAFNTEAQHFKATQWLIEENGFLILTQQGKLFADHIASSLFV